MATSPVSSTLVPDFWGTIPPSAWQSTPLRTANTAPPIAKPVLDPNTSIQPPMDAEHREQMLLEHMPVVRFVARKIHERLPQHIELDDLIGAGIVGLIDAFNKFDHRKEVQFRSYAQFRIRGAILDSLRSLDWGTRDMRKKGREIDDVMQRLMHKLHRRPTEIEMAEQLELPLVQYQRLLGELRSLEVGSLNELHADDSTDEVLDYVQAAPEADPLARYLKGEMSSQLCAAIAKLPAREARILKLYYVEEMTLKQIGELLGLAESRISQIRTAAVIELRAHLQHSTKMSTRKRVAVGRARVAVPTTPRRKVSVAEGSLGRRQLAG